MNAGAINPAAIPIPNVDPEGVRSFGNALKHDGATVADTGHDINAAWKGLTYSYHAPEAPRLFAAIAPVQAAGEDFKQAASTAGDALVAFAAAADYNLQRFRNLQAEATAFNAKIADNDGWREDAGLAEENDDLVQAVAFTALAYREQETICANKIAALVGGTQTTPVKPGTADLEGIKTPWGQATGQDKPWYLDAGDAVKDFLGSSATDLAAMAGLVNQEGKLTGVDGLGDWWGNIRSSWGGLVEGIAGLGGLHDPEEGWGWHGVDSLGESWKQLAQSFVPWQEWEHREGYVATTGALNIGSLFIPGYGIAKAVTKLRKVSHRADADPPDPLSPDDLPRGPNDNPRLPSTTEIQGRLQQTIDDLAKTQDLDKEFTKLDDKLDDLHEPEPEPDREPAMAGGRDHTPDIRDHHDPSDDGPPANGGGDHNGEGGQNDGGDPAGDGQRGDPPSTDDNDPAPPPGEGQPGTAGNEFETPGPLGRDFAPGVHEGPNAGMLEHERELARLRASEGRHVTSLPEDHSREGAPSIDVLERSSPSDPGRVTEYKTFEGDSVNSVKKLIRKAFDKFNPARPEAYEAGDIALDGRKTIDRDIGLAGMEDRLSQEIRSGTKIGRVGTVDLYTRDGHKLTYEGGIIYDNGNAIRRWDQGRWVTP